MIRRSQTTSLERAGAEHLGRGPARRRRGGLAVGYLARPRPEPARISPPGASARLALSRHDPADAARSRRIDPADLSRGLLEYAGWSVRPVDQFQLDVVACRPPGADVPDHARPGQGPALEVLQLHPPRARAPAADAGRRLRVGCLVLPARRRPADAALRRAQRTGLLPGPFAGRPLARDRLVGPDRAALDARRLRRAADPGGRVRAPARTGRAWSRRSTPLGFADAMGLKMGDVPVKFGLAGKIVTERRLLRALRGAVAQHADRADRPPKVAGRAGGPRRAGRGGARSTRPRRERPRRCRSSWARTANGCSGCRAATTTPRSPATRSSSAGT